MLETGKCYRDNAGDKVMIGGRIKKYDPAVRPWVWSISGDWYDENTGAFITTRRLTTAMHDYEQKPLAVDNRRSISNHQEYNYDDGRELTIPIPPTTPPHTIGETTMKNRYDGYLYGHYDSRGGSVFVQATTVEEANEKYNKTMGSTSLFLGHQKREVGFADDDLIGPAAITTDEDLTTGQDLDKGELTAFLWNGTKDEFPADLDDYEILYAREASGKYVKPRWDDDAFGLIFIS